MKLKDTKISVCIWSSDYKSLAKWYEYVLGFKVRKKLDLPNDTGIDFDFEDTYFFIGKHDQITGNNTDPYRMMVGFNVESISKAYSEIENKNVIVIAKPFESPEGGYWCMTIQDPEGNILQFFGDK